jgi:hypothetical protein
MNTLLDKAGYEMAPRRRGGHRPGRADRMYCALCEGMDIEDVADEEGITVAGVRVSLKKAGVDHAQFPTRNERFLIGLFGPVFRATDRQAAEIMNMTPHRVYAIRENLGIPINPERH